ncbi:MAG: nucleotide exchange factor GrpE [Bacteroidetes bacterium]|nr:nucleotide exchange factor GrpE [Bacteroidota bacterium]MBS1684600.1 nucleotide exchange factor GrpE [Bacteroidota bacterium]
MPDMEENKDYEKELPQDGAGDETLSHEDTQRVLDDINAATADPRDEEIASLKKQLEEYKDKHIRLYADFDNFKKRNAKERLELILTASKDVIKELLPVIDDFERALKAAETASDVAAVKEGMALIYHKLTRNLEAKGLKAIESKGKDFDVELHEAITEIPAPAPDMAGKVIDEVEKGYYLNDKIIRFAKVVVGK